MCEDYRLFSGLFDYKSETGKFYWKVRRAPNALKGQEAGVVSHGYISLTVHSVKYKAHRVAWLLTYGNWPEGMLDHINGIRDDNRISNLRLANDSQNSMNRGIRSDNTSGISGIHFHKNLNKWRVQIEVGEKRRHIGVFNSLSEAKAARIAAEALYHGAFPRHSSRGVL